MHGIRTKALASVSAVLLSAGIVAFAPSASGQQCYVNCDVPTTTIPGPTTTTTVPGSTTTTGPTTTTTLDDTTTTLGEELGRGVEVEVEPEVEAEFDGPRDEESGLVLAFTGGDILGLLAIAGGALGLGAALTAGSRRTRRS